LELGRFLVSELLENRSTDTLARWLLHTIADRLAQIENLKKSHQRNKLENEAADLILKLWRHRAMAADGLDPLSKYDRVFKSLSLLLPKANPWQMRETTAPERSAADLYNCLSLLSTALMLLSVNTFRDRPQAERRMLMRFLPTNEAAMLLHFERVEGIVSDNANIPDNANPSEPEVPKFTELYEHIVRTWVEHTRGALDEVTLILDRLSESNKTRRGNSPSKRASEPKKKRSKRSKP
jgi:hypothetical protein